MSPERGQYGSGGLICQPLKHHVGRPAQAIPPLRVANAQAVEQSLQDLVLVEHGETEGGGKPAPEGRLPASRKTGHDDKASQASTQKLSMNFLNLSNSSFWRRSPARRESFSALPRRFPRDRESFPGE